MSLDVGSVEVVSEQDMAVAFDTWAKQAKEQDGFHGSLKFLEDLQGRIDNKTAIRIGYSVVDTKVSPEILKNVSAQLSEVNNPMGLFKIGAIIGGGDTVIEEGFLLAGRPMVVSSRLLFGPSGSNTRKIIPSLKGRSIVINSTVTGSAIENSSIDTSTVAYSNVVEGSSLEFCDLRESVLVDARLRSVEGSTGWAALKGNMEGMNLSYAGYYPNGHVLATPRSSR